jgi:hypothetical protein
MPCANCQAEATPAYTLRAHVDSPPEGGDVGEVTVDLRFCSAECLRAWT